MVFIEFCDDMEEGYILANTQQEHFVFCQLCNKWSETYHPILKTSSDLLIRSLWGKKRKFKSTFLTFEDALKEAIERTTYWKTVTKILNVSKHDWFQIDIKNFTKSNIKKEGFCQDKDCNEFSYRRMWTIQLADKKWPYIETIKKDGTRVCTSGW